MSKFKKVVLPFIVVAVVGAGATVPAGASASVGDPILFVHGWNGNAGQFDGMKARFKSAGWTDGQLATLSYRSYQSNVNIANSVRSSVSQLLAANPGKAKVVLVSHSMGGLSTRYYVRNLGGLSTVKTFVSLAGANHGTSIAQFCAFYGDPGCREMVPGSSFLSALNAGDETPGAINYATWWSRQDGVIVPATSTILAGAQNTEVPNVAHNDQFNNPTIQTGVLNYVTSR